MLPTYSGIQFSKIKATLITITSCYWCIQIFTYKSLLTIAGKLEAKLIFVTLLNSSTETKKILSLFKNETTAYFSFKPITRKIIVNIIGYFHRRIFFSMFFGSKIFFFNYFGYNVETQSS